MAGSSKRRGFQDENKVPRSRAPNFTDSEKDSLIEEIMPRFKEFLENKRQDAVPLKVKDAKWEEATVLFNSLSGRFVRTAKQLRDLWGNLKATARAAAASERVEMFATGGGTVDRSKGPTARDLQVLAVLGESGRGLETRYGGDAVEDNGCGEEQEAVAANPGVLVATLAQGEEGEDGMSIEVVYAEGQDNSNMDFSGIEVPPQVLNLSEHNWSTHCPRNLYLKKPAALRTEPLQPATTAAEPVSSQGSAEVNSTSTPVSSRKRSISEELEWAKVCKKRTPTLLRQKDDETKKELAEAKLAKARTLQKFLSKDEKMMEEKLEQMKREEERKVREEERREALFQLELEKHKLELAKLKRELGE
ncbi:Myb/SANT-like DNA-binding domain-containing protein 3 [Frankliniella fusca]|uniref:Regulatory protein zeste n=1 Tax=Frankliniella fusca TaxID=407009 RepID=A0AAE1LIR6_9NEOP|nr:Myb/SANT-like DNA-binding domain-containing protein 3 [Frankliniella fusca]